METKSSVNASMNDLSYMREDNNIEKMSMMNCQSHHLDVRIYSVRVACGCLIINDPNTKIGYEVVKSPTPDLLTSILCFLELTPRILSINVDPDAVYDANEFNSIACYYYYCETHGMAEKGSSEKYFLKAIELGSILAMINLAHIYLGCGYDNKKNDGNGIALYEQAINLGCNYAIYMLLKLYLFDCVCPCSSINYAFIMLVKYYPCCVKKSDTRSDSKVCDCKCHGLNITCRDEKILEKIENLIYKYRYDDYKKVDIQVDKLNILFALHKLQVNKDNTQDKIIALYDNFILKYGKRPTFSNMNLKLIVKTYRFNLYGRNEINK